MARFWSLCLVLALSLSTGLSMESLKAEDGYDVFPAFNASRYKLLSYRLNWEDALFYCQNDGVDSNLAVINSEMEAEAVRALTARLVGSGFWFAWVGINDIDTEGSWVTVQGGPVTASGYTEWGPEQPNEGTYANCGYVELDALYYDADCTKVWPFICEKPNV